MSKIIGKWYTGSDHKEYLRLEDADFIWDRDIGMADHWGDDFITALLAVLSLMYGEGHIITVHSVPEPKFKVGHGKAKFENGIHVDIIRVEKGHRSNFYAVAIPFLIDECYLHPV